MISMYVCMYTCMNLYIESFISWEGDNTGMYVRMYVCLRVCRPDLIYRRREIVLGCAHMVKRLV
jgi:hypothetical protein